RRAPGPLRVVALPEPPVPGIALHPECRAAFDGAVALLRGLGHQVDELELPADEQLLDSFTRVWEVMATTLPVAPEDEKLLMPLTRHLREEGGKIGATAFAGALYAFRALGEMISDALLGTYDVILTPTLAQLPALVGGLRNDEDPGAEFAGLAAFTPYTPLYNATGQPAVSVPLHWTDEGLPVGIMLGGRYGDDATLISLSAQLEAAQPWAARRPALW
ncbi:amidase family protein, partial [Streptomyces sp. 12297]